MTSEVRRLAAGEEEAFARSVTVPFLERSDGREVAHNLRILEPERAWVAVDRDRLVANAAILTRTVTLPCLPGQACPTVPLAAVSQVGVHPTHRRRGLLRLLMDELLDDARRRGEPIAGLKASEGGIYGRFGFGLATQVARWSLDPRRSGFLAPPPARDIRLVDAGEASKVLPGMHERFRTIRAGEVDRDDAFWSEQFERATAASPAGGGTGSSEAGDEPASFYAVAGDDLGYVAYRATDTSDGVHFSSRAEVGEVYAADPDTEAALWRFVLDIDLVTEIVARRRPLDEPLRWRLADPRQLRVRAVEDLLWVRILDVPAALEARGYAGEGRLAFEVLDGEDAVRGGWVLEAGPAGATCRRASTGGGRSPSRAARSRPGPSGTAPGLRLGIAELGSLLLGGVAASALAAAGRVQVLDAVELAIADRLFPTPMAPFSGTSF